MADKNLTITVKNIASGPRGLHTVSGFVLLDAGEERSLELTPAEAKSAGSTGHFSADGKVPAAAKVEAPASEPLQAVHRGAGSYSIMRGDAPVEAVESMSKEDADAFNELSDDDKAAYVAAHAKAAD